MPTGATDATISEDPRREDEATLLARFVRRVLVVILAAERCRLVADALKDSVMELRKVEETKMSQYVHGGFSHSNVR